jgi:hypothetical protein
MSMINGVVPQGKYIYLHGGHLKSPCFTMDPPSAGLLRYNGSQRLFETYDGQSWLPILGHDITVGLNPEAESLLDWVKSKQEEEKNWKSLAVKNDAVKIALENLERARHQLDVTAKLARKHERLA